MATETGMIQLNGPRTAFPNVYRVTLHMVDDTSRCKSSIRCIFRRAYLCLRPLYCPQFIDIMQATSFSFSSAKGQPGRAGLYLAAEWIISPRWLFVSHHSNCVTGQQRRHVQNHIVCHVGQQVDDGHYGHGNGNGQGEIPTTTTTSKTPAKRGLWLSTNRQ